MVSRQRIARRLLSGRVHLRIWDGDFYLRPPTPFETYRAEELYEESLRDSLEKDVPDETTVIDSRIDMGLWSLEEEQQLKVLAENIDKLKMGLFECYFEEPKRVKIREYLKVSRVEQGRLLEKKLAWSDQSAEGIATLIKARFLVGTCLVCEDGVTRALPEAFRDGNHPLLDEAVAAQAAVRLDEHQLRDAVRNDPWRNAWVTREACGGLFSQSSAELSDEQIAACVWSRIYDQARECGEAPPDDIFDEDDAFDGWMLVRRKKDEERRREEDGKSLVDKRLENYGEVFVMTTDDPESISRVENLNDEKEKFHKRRRAAYLEKHGAVHEAQMPDSAELIRQALIKKMGGG